MHQPDHNISSAIIPGGDTAWSPEAWPWSNCHTKGETQTKAKKYDKILRSWKMPKVISLVLKQVLHLEKEFLLPGKVYGSTFPQVSSMKQMKQHFLSNICESHIIKIFSSVQWSGRRCQMGEILFLGLLSKATTNYPVFNRVCQEIPFPTRFVTPLRVTPHRKLASSPPSESAGEKGNTR